MDDPLIWVRALHYASTVAVAGAIFFQALVAEPSFRAVNDPGRVASLVRSRVAMIAWTGLGFVVLTGLAWLALLAERMGDSTLPDVFSEGIIWTVLASTDFGWDWMLRLIFAALLAATMIRLRRPIRFDWAGGVAMTSAAGLIGTLAWAGHAAANSGVEGNIHLLADVLHLIAAAAWIGALVPLALLLHAVRADQDGASAAIATAAVLRFSRLGVASVATLIATGTVNSWMLLGGVPDLIGTDYGRLLLVKIALFSLMLSIAAVNRFRLTPRMTKEPGALGSRDALRRIESNSLLEAGIGTIVILIVAVLGTMAPGLPEQVANQGIETLFNLSHGLRAAFP